MSGASTQMRLAGAVLGAAVLLVAVLVARNTGQKRFHTDATPPAEDVPACSGALPHSKNSQPSSGADGHPHSVILSWNAAVPVSALSRDAIQGYHVYRSAAPGIYGETNRISAFPVQGTRCLDATVEPQKTYYYAVKAVSQNGTRSKPSAEIRVVVPTP